MENMVLVGLSREVALRRELGTIANNIANLNTTGFKADGTLFQQYLAPDARDGGFGGADARLNFVQDRANWLNLGQGAIQQTGNPLDVALDGKGFLVVQTPSGQRYTRNGALQINAAGQLVTSLGDPVIGDSGPIVLQPTDRNVVINADGSIRVREGTSATSDASRGKLRIVEFAQPQQLQKEGTSLFKANPNMQPLSAKDTRVVQGAVEKSNVQGVLEMTRMIEVTRSYNEVAAILQQQSSLGSDAIDKLAEVPA
jgi:flagellar basal-body rod protein FlgF